MASEPVIEREEVVSLLAVLFDIRRELTFIRRTSRAEWARKRAEEELRNDPTMQLLQERIAYHKAKLAEERAAKSGA
jgi:hypothetical protein